MRRGKLAALVFTALAVSAQSPPSPDPMEMVKAQARPIVRDASGRYSGEAWDSLVADAAGSQFVMVGEQHGSGDIARFEAALHRQLARRGFTHSALEVGPTSTRFAERLIRSGKGRLQDYISAPGHGFVLPFLFFAEEAEMAETMVGTSPDKEQALFGLDQEFVGAAPILVAELRSMATTAAQKQALDAFAAEAERDAMIVGKLGAAQLDPLEKAFAGNRPALRIIEAMRISARIYAPFLTGKGSGYLGNLERETYMKRNFVQQFEAARSRNGSAPKVFFKFGGNHAMRGMTGTNVPGLGNFLAEWGLPKNYRMVNLLVDCIGGEAMNPQTNKAAPCESYFGDGSLITRAIADGPAVQIVDLRALRPQLTRGLKGADEASRKTILAFDYYVAVKGGAAATPLGKLAN